jgi:hypothetical protein
MEGESIFQMNSVNTLKNIEFKGNIHAVIPHNKIELLKGRIGPLQK